METYREFLDRIQFFEHQKWSFGPGYFKGNPSLVKKVHLDNTFRPFYGDTVVFDLDDTTKERLTKWLDELYAIVPECFSERLATDTLHMTLHDLSNSDDFSEVAEEIEMNREQVQSLRNEISKFNTIKMNSKCMFNMVNTSLVLGLYPADETEYKKLMTLYETFNEVKKLPYPLTPHITLAYYNVHGFNETSARKLEELVCHLNCVELENEMEIVLKAEKLYYQHFDSMNHYTNVLPVFGE
ncbi:MAG: hypothetical protein IKL28_03405 [Lachnospiraceae bacterium]|nr:hypothetical protein [Lachnospiraceae bacterium]